jgi:hypothetical protein
MKSISTIEPRAAGIMGPSEEIRFVVHRMQDGQPLAGKIRSAWECILRDAGLDEDVVRHTLRHTAATWSIQAGTDMWQAAGSLGMTVEQLQETTSHHHPDFQSEAAEAFGGHRWLRRYIVSVSGSHIHPHRPGTFRKQRRPLSVRSHSRAHIRHVAGAAMRQKAGTAAISLRISLRSRNIEIITH